MDLSLTTGVIELQRVSRTGELLAVIDTAMYNSTDSRQKMMTAMVNLYGKGEGLCWAIKPNERFRKVIDKPRTGWTMGPRHRWENNHCIHCGLTRMQRSIRTGDVVGSAWWYGDVNEFFRPPCIKRERV